MASLSASCPNIKSSALLGVSGGSPLQQPHHQHQQHSKISFQLSSISKPSLLSGSSSLDQPAFPRFQGPTRKQSNIWKVHGQLNEAVGKTSNSTPLAQTKLEVPSSEGKKDDLAEESAVQNGAPDASSISAFMDQVSELVKLVDSRDIIELQLKQLDCELIIRKKEALPQAPVAAPVVMMQPPPQGMVSSQLPQAPPTAPASPSPAPSAPALALPPPPAKSKSSHPPLKCPMAGTFYRCPGPGEPPFVKVGDKVQKGQVVCIIEAMKLMNEIEADQSGTIVEVLVEDGKPVSVDMPLFVIEP